MNILSLFDGMSCGYEALERAGIKIDNYFASEIDKYAIEISKKNHPDIIHIGSVTDINASYFHNNWVEIESENGRYPLNRIDLLIGGSPCQDLSIAKKDGKGLAGEKSSLFFEYVRLLNETKPKYFLLENVASMRKADKDEITRILGVEPIMINSSLLSAQNRKRLYWIGERKDYVWGREIMEQEYVKVDIPQPEDKQIFLKDILEDIPFDNPMWKPLDEKYLTEERKVKIAEATKLGYIEPIDGDCVDMAQPKSTTRRGRLMRYKSNAITTGNQFYLIREKSFCLDANYAKVGPVNHENGLRTCIFAQNNENIYDKIEEEELADMLQDRENAVKHDGYMWRKLTPTECERLQTLKDGYTEGVSNSQRYKMIGNGWTVDVIAHILSFIR